MVRAAVPLDRRDPVTAFAGLCPGPTAIRRDTTRLIRRPHRRRTVIGPLLPTTAADLTSRPPPYVAIQPIARRTAGHRINPKPCPPMPRVPLPYYPANRR